MIYETNVLSYVQPSLVEICMTLRNAFTFRLVRTNENLFDKRDEKRTRGKNREDAHHALIVVLKVVPRRTDPYPMCH